ncbi:P21Rho-binding domain containing protein [Acanthamoeba castellanii str. Neff]|uniref:p21Rho-binding domain containing protein n=1 Tax=Acanthamoeba castellanii (strain ATCC 30010 / Neff) TaxID=1257118 RepID=L8H3X7_ACACF|nr:P21Rho-binding domain containing protein [Acanthamoeba castellanii str. Neff]ELR19116.1 P21Rho-binding domain containing protein [Acanthamoeba castellanii str. Neff]
MELEVAGLGKEELKPIVSEAGGTVKAAAVARMYKGNDDGSWHYTGAWGAMGLVSPPPTFAIRPGGKLDTHHAILSAYKVYVKNEMAYHLRLIDLKTKQLAWTQELYYEFQYDCSNVSFHFFESNDTVIGLAFAHEGDAQRLAKASLRLCLTPDAGPLAQVLDHSPSREKLAAIASQFRAAGGIAEVSSPHTEPPPLKPEGKRKSGILSRLIKKKEPTNKTISVISGPTNVKHEVHLGWDARDGFKVRNIPLEWKKLFQAAGVKKSDLKDADTAKFLIETVAHTRQTLRGQAHAPTQFGSPQAVRRETAAGAGGPTTAPEAAPAPPPPVPPPPAPPAPIAGGLAAALQARLKKSDKPTDSATSQYVKNLPIPDLVDMDEKEGADLAVILATAMQARRGVLRQDSDEEVEVEDEEWTTDEEMDF